MVRVVLGLLKGGAVGALIGWGALKLGIGAGAAAVACYALIGGLAGIIAGKPPWKQDTFWTSALKGLFGLVVGIALYFGARRLLGGTHAAFTTAWGIPDRPLVEVPLLLGPIIGAAWGIFVEIDDSVGGGDKAAAKAKPKAG
jgi:hypothetical protein